MSEHRVSVYGQSREVQRRKSWTTDFGVQVTIDPIIDFKLGYVSFLFGFAKCVKEFIGNDNYDVVEFGNTGGLFLFFRHPNIVVRLHNTERYFKKRSRGLVFFEKLSFAVKKVKIVAVSRFIQRSFQDYFWFTCPLSTEYISYNGTKFIEKKFRKMFLIKVDNF